MKTVLALAGFAVVLVAVPWWSGGVAVSGFEELDATIADASRGRMLSTTTVERGVLRSFATTQLGAVRDESGGASESSIQIRHTIFHGPLPIGELLHGRLPRGLSQALVETEILLPSIAPNRVIATVTTRVEWSGLTRVELDAPAYERDIPSIRWSGAKGSLVASGVEFERVSGYLEMPGLEISFGENEASIEDIFMDVDAEPSASEGLALGAGSVSVGRVHVSTADQQFELTGLRWGQRADVDAETETYSSTFRTDLEAFALAGDDYGPGAFELVLRNLDLKALGELQGLANTPPSEELDAEAASKRAMEPLQQLLAQSPELEITELSFTSPDGTLQGTGQARIDGESPALAMGVLGAMSALSAEADLLFPPRLLHKLLDQILADQLAEPTSTFSVEAARAHGSGGAALRSEWLDRLLSAGYVQLTPDGYRVRLEFAGGGLRLNGLPVDPALLSPMRGT
jgi:uncharacterized protein YdgA (DUF945 family)